MTSACARGRGGPTTQGSDIFFVTLLNPSTVVSHLSRHRLKSAQPIFIFSFFLDLSRHPLKSACVPAGTWISEVSTHLNQRQPVNYENGSGVSTILAEQYKTAIGNKKLSLPFENSTQENLIFHTEVGVSNPDISSFFRT